MKTHKQQKKEKEMKKTIICAILVMFIYSCGGDDSCEYWEVLDPIKERHEKVVNEVYAVLLDHGYNPLCKVRLVYDPGMVIAGSYTSDDCTVRVNMYDFPCEHLAGTLAHEVGHALGIVDENEARAFARNITEHMR